MWLGRILKWLAVLAAIAGAVGSTAALFLWSLDRATLLRFENPWLVYLLPMAGLAMGFYYRRFGKHVSSGNHVILGHVYKERARIPWLLAPSVVIATVATHLFGARPGARALRCRWVRR